jgi:pimeloyl-ACP methyl ester carboxylesterase
MFLYRRSLEKHFLVELLNPRLMINQKSESDIYEYRINLQPESCLFSEMSARVNKKLKELFQVQVPENAITYDTSLLYSEKAPIRCTVGEGPYRINIEMYLPVFGTDRGIRVITQHGYAGTARDWSKMAVILQRCGIGTVSMDMHQSSGDDYARMCFSAKAWADTAESLYRYLPAIHGRKRIFVGQSSGGTAALDLLARGKERHKFDAALLVAPTLVQCISPQTLLDMDSIVAEGGSRNTDVLLSWEWLSFAFEQMSHTDMNRAYQNSCRRFPGFPYRGARECIVPPPSFLDKLRSVDIPTFFVQGSDDAIDSVSIEAARSYARQNPNPYLVFQEPVENAGHQVHIENPQKIAYIIAALSTAIEREP